MSVPTQEKVYLGDGAYAEFRFQGSWPEIIITAENGIVATDRVVLGIEEINNLVSLLDRHFERKAAR